MSKQRLSLFVPEGKSSPRVKKVAREIRRILSEIFMRQDIPPVWDDEGTLVPFPGPLTVTDVQLSADLVECRVFVMPLANKHADAIAPYFALATPLVRKQFAQYSELRLVPNFHFSLDTSFAVAEKIDALIFQNHEHLPHSEQEDSHDD